MLVSSLSLAAAADSNYYVFIIKTACDRRRGGGGSFSNERCVVTSLFVLVSRARGGRIGGDRPRRRSVFLIALRNRRRRVTLHDAIRARATRTLPSPTRVLKVEFRTRPFDRFARVIRVSVRFQCAC